MLETKFGCVSSCLYLLFLITSFHSWALQYLKEDNLIPPPSPGGGPMPFIP